MCKEEFNNIACPHCNSSNIWRFGKYHNRTRYRCKDCLKTFTNTTNKPWSYSKKSKNTWNKYIDLMMNSTTLRKCAKLLNISLTTAFYWRHKLLDNVDKDYGNPKLSDEVSIMKSKLKENRKGQRNLIHEARLFNITYAIDNNKHFLIDLCEGFVTIKMYDKIFKKHVEKNAIVLRTNNAIINHSSKRFNKKYIDKKGVGVFYKYGKFKTWLKVFKGIATKNIIKYHHYFQNLQELNLLFEI